MTIYGVEPQRSLRQPSLMLDTDELLARLRERGIRNVEIARVLNLPDSRIPEIKEKRRSLKLDEAAALVRAFGLEQDPQEARGLPASLLRLAILHVAQRLGAPLAEGELRELAEDLRAFSEFASDPKVRQSAEAAEGFFRALSIRRPRPVEEAPPGTDPERTH